MSRTPRPLTCEAGRSIRPLLTVSGFFGPSSRLLPVLLPTKYRVKGRLHGGLGLFAKVVGDLDNRADSCLAESGCEHLQPEIAKPWTGLRECYGGVKRPPPGLETISKVIATKVSDKKAAPGKRAVPEESAPADEFAYTFPRLTFPINLAYCALACIKAGTSASALLHNVKNLSNEVLALGTSRARA